MQQTFFVPGWVSERYPAVVELSLERALHGYLHERSNELTRDDEAAVLERLHARKRQCMVCTTQTHHVLRS
jgi:peptidoglycan/xylan/chitin deacetylase (PgdA/CDA1 family)